MGCRQPASAPISELGLGTSNKVSQVDARDIVVAAIIGTIQAAEAIKWITGIGEPLAGRLLVHDGTTMQFETVTVKRNSTCPVCNGEIRGKTRT